ncbi:MAG: thioredoxin [Ignavibacteriales bacterium]|nr:thioredoxin [Ignavibacteriales bacterium]MCF8315423.1 thioredoxin [Ignavibacteriales bacterium]MCF8438667.1 thioredoxin [Ignavibacteriales bacterium]
MKPMVISDSTFEAEVIKSPIPVMIDFWAEWCQPCKAIAPILDQIADEYDGKVKVCKLDVDDNQQSAIKYGVRSIPTVLIFKDGQLRDTIIGAVAKNVFTSKLDNVIRS